MAAGSALVGSPVPSANPVAQFGEERAPCMTEEHIDKSTAAGIPWARFASVRRECSKRWPGIFDLKVKTSFFSGIDKHLPSVGSLLDVGATNRGWEPALRSLWPGLQYASLDIDSTHEHDYRDFSELDRSFDVVLCLEVIEHVAPDESIRILRQCARACRPGGLVLVSVPNVCTPGIQLEFTHQTAVSHRDLAALATWVGLEVLEVYRVTFRPRRSRWMHWLLHPLHRVLAIDYCQSVLIEARRPETPSSPSVDAAAQ